MALPTGGLRAHRRPHARWVVAGRRDQYHQALDGKYAMKNHPDLAGRLRLGRWDAEQGDLGRGSDCERGCCHRRLAETCGCALLWLRRRRWPAGRLCCRRNSRQRIGKAISISLLRACSGLLLWAGSVSWLLAMAPRVPLSGVLSRDGTESSRAAWKFPSGGSKPLQLVMA